MVELQSAEIAKLSSGQSPNRFGEVGPLKETSQSPSYQLQSRPCLEKKIMPTLSYGKIVLDTQAHTAAYDGRAIKLNPKEYALLELFLSYPRHVLSYDTIVDRVWYDKSVPTQSCIRTHIKRLRQAFGAIDYPGEIIDNVRGLGYRLRPLPEAEGEILRPSNEVLQRFFSTKAIEYLVLDNSWNLRYLSPGAIHYSDDPASVRLGSAVCEGFLEFVGLEPTFEEIATGKLEGFEMKGISRRRNVMRPDYISFYIVADRDSPFPNRLFVFFEDSSDYMLSRQRLVQRSNEIILLLERCKSV